MIDIIIFCAIAAVLVYKLYTSFGKETLGVSQSGEKQSKGSQAKTKQLTIVDALIKTPETKSEDAAHKNKIVAELIENLRTENNQLLTALPPQDKQIFDDFFAKTPAFDVSGFVGFSKAFFEEFFTSFYSGSLERLKSFILDDALTSLKEKSSVACQNVLQKTLLYKIENVVINGFEFVKNNPSFKISIEALKIEFGTSEAGELTSGSKKLPVKFSTNLQFTKFEDKSEKDSPSRWVLMLIS